MDDESLLPAEGSEGAIDAPVADEPSQEAPSVEDLAGDMGWKPQDQWKGDPEKWRPAHEFVRHTVDVNRNLVTKLHGVEQRLDTLARTSSRITEEALARQREELLAKRNEAFETGDREEFVKADKALAELKPIEQAPPAEAQAFVERNSAWFNKDEEATRWAQLRCDELARQGLSHARQLAIVERELPGLFPEYAPKEAAKPKPAPLTQPGARSAAPSSRGVSALPDEARKAGQSFVAKGIFKTLDDYAKVYFEELGS